MADSITVKIDKFQEVISRVETISSKLISGEPSITYTFKENRILFFFSKEELDYLFSQQDLRIVYNLAFKSIFLYTPKISDREERAKITLYTKLPRALFSKETLEIIDKFIDENLKLLID